MSYLIIINGPIGGGKTTTAKSLWKRLPRTAIISLDDLKWFISDYTKKDLAVASKVGQVMAKEYLRNGVNVIVEKVLSKQEHVRPFIRMGKACKARIYQYSVEAPLPVLIKRTRDRSNRRKKMPVSKVKRIYNEYIDNKYKVLNVFDSSKMSISGIVKRILKDIKTNSKN